MRLLNCIRVSLAVLVLAMPGVSPAQGYPTQPIRMIITVAPGGATDLLGRIVGEKMSESLRQPIVYDNKPGASGAIAAEAAARSPADGYTLLVGSSSTMVLLPVTNPKLSYDSQKDFVPIGMMIRGDNIIVVRSTLGLKTLKELVSYAKANPRKLSYGTVGVGTGNHLAAELLSEVAGIEMLHVPYKSGPAIETDLVADRIDLVFNNIPPAINNIRQGKTFAIAVAGSKRNSLLPEVPTTREAGYPFEIYGWGGLFAPRGIPKSAQDRLALELRRAMALPDVAERLTKIGLDPYYLGSDETASFLKTELESWRSLVAKRNMKFD